MAITKEFRMIDYVNASIIHRGFNREFDKWQAAIPSLMITPHGGIELIEQPLEATVSFDRSFGFPDLLNPLELVPESLNKLVKLQKKGLIPLLFDDTTITFEEGRLSMGLNGTEMNILVGENLTRGQRYLIGLGLVMPHAFLRGCANGIAKLANQNVGKQVLGPKQAMLLTDIFVHKDKGLQAGTVEDMLKQNSHFGLAVVLNSLVNN